MKTVWIVQSDYHWLYGVFSTSDGAVRGIKEMFQDIERWENPVMNLSMDATLLIAHSYSGGQAKKMVFFIKEWEIDIGRIMYVR